VELGELAERLEKISARYEERVGFARNADWFLLKLQEEVGELTQAYLHQEFADPLCQLLLFAKQHDVDLPAEIDSKWLVYET
jgi:NTP pyrophosphatase (non-canonical NTP hydrolase)